MTFHRAEAAANFLDAARELIFDAADPERDLEFRLGDLETAEQRLRFVSRELEIARADLNSLKGKDAAA